MQIATYKTTRSQVIAVCSLVLFLVGCGKNLPEIVNVTGDVKINGDPISNAAVKFIPLADGLDGNFMAKGITDKEGKFVLSMPGSKPGCPASNCTVTIKEGPVPDKVRKLYESEGGSNKPYEQFKRSLKNRPIPDLYQRMSTTPLKAEVTAENTNFQFDLKR